MNRRSLCFIRTLEVNNASWPECLIDCIESQGNNSNRGLSLPLQAPPGGGLLRTTPATLPLPLLRMHNIPIILTQVRREHRWTSSRSRWRTREVYVCVYKRGRECVSKPPESKSCGSAPNKVKLKEKIYFVLTQSIRYTICEILHISTLFILASSSF